MIDARCGAPPPLTYSAAFGKSRANSGTASIISSRRPAHARIIQREAGGSTSASEGSPADAFCVALPAIACLSAKRHWKSEMSVELDIADCINKVCPWSGKPVSADSLLLYRGAVVGFCNHGCRDKFQKATALFDQLIDTRQAAETEGPPTVV
jgi:hypothetical protein